MASIEHRGDAWVVRWRDPDGKDRTRRCPDQATAKTLRRDVEAELALGRRWKPRDARPAPRETLRGVGAAWLQSIARRLRPRSVVLYGWTLEAFTRWVETQEGADPSVSVLSRTLLEGWWDNLRDRKNAPATMHQHLRILHAFWAWAADREEYTLVPRARLVELPPQETTGETLAPTWAQMDACIGKLQGWHRTAAILMRCTGLRASQAMRLQRGDVDVDLGRLTIRPELGKTRFERSGRRVPIAQVLLDELRTPRLAEWGTTWLVPSGPASRRMHDQEIRVRGWIAAGVPAEVWAQRPCHAFRRGFVTGIRAAGAEWHAVEYLVGHKLPGMQQPYVDAWKALKLVDAVNTVPEIQA